MNAWIPNLLIVSLAAGCVAPPENVVENDPFVELDPPATEGEGARVFEVTAHAEIDPPYDPDTAGFPSEYGVRLFHCGAEVFSTEEDVRVPEDVALPDDVAAVALLDFDDFAQQGIDFGGAGPFNLSVVYGTDGAPLFSDSGTWDEPGLPFGTFPRSLDPSVPLFRFNLSGDGPTLEILDASASYNSQTQSLSTTYTFVTEAGSLHTITETYTFGGRRLPVVSVPTQPCA